MSRHFKPNTFRAKEERRDKKIKTIYPSKPVTVHIFQYFKIITSPKTKIQHYTVNPNMDLDLDLVRDKLNEYFPCLVDIRSVMLLPWFEVILDVATPWGEVCEKTLKAMSEIIDSV